MKGNKPLAIFTAFVMAAGVGIVIGASPARADNGGTIDYNYFTKMGWTPIAGTLPNLACNDTSYKLALSRGIKLGVYDAMPYMGEVNGKQVGIDWEINDAVLHYIGVTKVTPVKLQWPEMIPALLSKRIDVIAGNIHENPTRLKSIAFTTAAWWYGTNLVIQKSNPKGIKTWADLQKSGVNVGAIAGSYSAEFLSKLSPKVDLTVFQDASTEFQGLSGGKVDVLVEDGPKAGAYLIANPTANMKILSPNGTNPPDDFKDGDGKYAMRPKDCTLLGAYSRGLAELRDHGIITNILKKYGLGDGDNLFMPDYKP